MIRYFFVLLIIIVNCLSVNANNFTTVLFASSNRITLHKDSVNTNNLLKLNVDTIDLATNVSKEKKHGVFNKADTLNKNASSPVKRNNSLKRNKTKKSSDLKKQDVVTSYNNTQSFTIVVSTVDSLKQSVESMRQTNDSILTILSDISNKSEEPFKSYCYIFFLLGIIAIFFIIMLIKKNRGIITNEVKGQTDVISKLQDSISLIEEDIAKSYDNARNCTNEVTKVLKKVNKMETSSIAMDEKIDIVLSELKNMPIIQPKETTSESKNSVERKMIDSVKEAENSPQITEVQYNDAISEFERINNRLFKLRKYKNYSQELLQFLSTGEMNKEEYTLRLGESDLPEDGKEHLNTILYDIERFNTQRRELISNYISQQKLTCFEIRYPLSAEFDDKLDHHFKGDDVADGEKIIRVCKLGYYFPKSHVAPYRVKSEVDTEKMS